MTDPDSAPPRERRGTGGLVRTVRVLLGLVIAVGFGAYLVSERGEDDGSGEVTAPWFEPSRATDAAHAALIGLADLPGAGWTVTATDDFAPSPPSDVPSCGASEAREAEINARYEPGRVSRANVTFAQLAADALFPMTVEVEVRVYGSASDTQGAVAAYAEYERSSTAAQCLADTVHREVVTGESLAPAPSDGAAVAYRMVAPAGASFGDIRFEHYLWPIGNGAVSVMLTGGAESLDRAFVRSVVETAARAATGAATATPSEGARRYVPNLAVAVTAIQNELAAVEAAKRLGDDLTVDAATGTLADVRVAAAAARTRLDQQSPPAELRAYHEAAVAWAADIVAATQGGTAVWRARPDAPAPSAPAVQAEQRHELVDLTLRRLATASEFGSLALAREDRTAARSVASRVAVQARLLQGLAGLAEASVCTRSGCLAAALPAAAAIVQVTASLATGSLDAASWGVVWDQASLAITPGGAPIPEAGITIGEVDAAPISEAVRLYTNACRAGGGLVDTTGGVTALPTTEDGWTCWSADRACYHHLTVSGWLYANGGTGQGCPPVAGLLDRVGVQQMAEPEVVRPAAPVDGAPPADGGVPVLKAWDGTYRVLTVSPFVCDDGSSGAVQDWEGTIVVLAGVIQGPVLSPTIGADGRVTVRWIADGAWLSEEMFTFAVGADGVLSYTSVIRWQGPFVPPPDYTGPARQVTVCTWTSTGVRVG